MPAISTATAATKPDRSNVLRCIFSLREILWLKLGIQQSEVERVGVAGVQFLVGYLTGVRQSHMHSAVISLWGVSCKD